METGISSIWEEVKESFEYISDLFTKTIFTISNSEISIVTILYFLFAFIVLSYLSQRFRNVLVNRILTRTHLDQSVRASIGTLSKLFILVIGTIIIIQSAGIDLSALTILAGALGVGIGFGLQNVTDNFISGLIILFEKPIKVGDRIEVGDVEGNVTGISFRATEVRTNDNISIIVPNSEFISKKVINWSHNDRNIRFRIPVGVSYKEDPAAVKQILLEVAKENPNVLKVPIPTVLFDAYGDSSLNFYLAVWTSSHTDRPRVLKSELYFAIFEKFKEHKIEIPFPQRDIHIKTSPVEVKSS